MHRVILHGSCRADGRSAALADELQKVGVEVYTVGDAAEPHNIQRAVTTGNLCARAL